MTWMKRAARIGYAAKGLTYILIALLALQAATGNGSAESTEGALRSLDGPTFGEIVLLGIAIGLASYALWKLYIVIIDPEDGGWSKRITALFVAFVNLGFAAEAASLAFSNGRGRNGDTAAHWSGIVMGHPLGRWAVFAAGLAVGGYGLAQLARALRRKVAEHLRTLELPSDIKRWVILACKFGIAARGLVFMLVGWFLVQAARQTDASEARDFGHSLNELRQQPMGRSMLFVVAFGLLAYAGYQILRSRFQRFQT